MRKLYLLGLLLIPVVAYANAVWPALYLETRLFSLWPILIGLVVEYFFVLKLLVAVPKQAAIATIAANTASALLGIIIIKFIVICNY